MGQEAGRQRIISVYTRTNIAFTDMQVSIFLGLGSGLNKLYCVTL